MQNKIYFDITDVLIWFSKISKPTGIQRTVVNMVLAFQAGDTSEVQYEFVFIDKDALSLKVVSPSSVYALMRLVSTDADRASIELAVNECWTLNSQCQASQGDIYVVIGAFWTAPVQERVLVHLKEQGVAIGVYLFDLIPVTNPEFVDRPDRLLFFRRLTQILYASDFVLAISEYTADKAREFLRDRLGLVRPVGVASLAGEAVAVADTGAQVSSAAAEVAKAPFVLCVGTIDHRKNQGYLVEAWRTMASENARPTPNLVLAGRWGLRTADLKQHLIDVGHVGGKVTVIEAPTDADLSFLYRACLFTVFPSLAEGWGLPVGESLAVGKPCIASNTGPIPEVGGDLVRYFDPRDLSSGLRELRLALDDEAGLAKWSARIAADFVPTTWRQCAVTLVSRILELAPRPDAPAPPFGPQLPTGVVFGMGAHSLGDAESAASAIAPLARIDGWYPVDPMMSWSMRPASTLRFRCEAALTGEIVVALAVRAAGPSTNNRVIVRSGDHITETSNLGPAVRWMFATAQVAADGVVELAISCEGDFPPPPPGDPRRLYVGLRAMGYAVPDDLPQRMDLLQSILGLGLA